MFGRRITLFKLFGFAVRLDMSWLILAVLVTWSLATGLFPSEYKGLTTAAYWWMGVAGALGLFLSIVFHELCHSLIARTYGLAMKGITLFIFGGVAEMDDEPPSAKAEFFMAIAGPISSFLLAAAFYGLRLVAASASWPVTIVGTFRYLAFLNLLLAVFNLIPGFPLDGGRVLRAILWHVKDNIRWATRIASRIGSAFGAALIALGVLSLLAGQFIPAVWWVLIGMFLRGAAKSAYQQLVVRRAMEGEKVRRFMTVEPVTVSPALSVADLVEHYVYRHHYKMYPVVDDGRLLGCVTIGQIKAVPREEWPRRTVGDLAAHCGPDNTVSADADALEAIAAMNRTQTSRLMVTDGGRLLGIISLKDMLKFLSLKVELEFGESAGDLPLNVTTPEPDSDED